MDRLVFGTAGIPGSTRPRNTVNGVNQTKRIGLGAMELEFVRGINVAEDKAHEIREAAEERGTVLTCHGPYYINLNSGDNKIREASVQRILKSAEIAFMCGGWSVCFHAAYYMGNKDMAYLKVKDALQKIVKELGDRGIKIWIRPETGGKISQFGSLDELINISQDVEGVLPCIDFSHHYARSTGHVNNYAGFADILEHLEKGLGRSSLDNMHVHAQGIEYGKSGERHHTSLKDSSFNYMELLKAIKDFKVKGVVICESPNTEQDALLLKSSYGSV